MTETKQFIETYILKRSEQIEWIDTENGDELYGYIVKRTPRVYHRLAEVWVSTHRPNPLLAPDKQLLHYKLSLHKAKPIATDDATLRNWFKEGWLVRKVTLSADGRTPKEKGYYMGPALHQYLEQEQKQKIKQEIDRFNHFQKELRSCLIPSSIPPSFTQKINQILSSDYESFKKSEQLEHWTFHKRIVFLQFLVALLLLRETKVHFDFKEIGASYFQQIGGSKVFDRYKDDFLNLLELWLEDNVESIGITSHGRVHSVYFSGNVKGEFSQFQTGTVHAVTDISLTKEHFHTTDQILWLVENRAMLTRLSTEVAFMKETASIVICLDGNIRSSHQKFVQQISESASLTQVIIWTDYDESGLVIARDAYQLIPQLPVTKWVASDGTIYRHFEAYADWLQQQLLIVKREQEEVLGDEKQWRKWINS